MIHIKVLNSMWKTICFSFRLNIKWRDHSESFQDGERKTWWITRAGHLDRGKWRCLLLHLLLSRIRELDKSERVARGKLAKSSLCWCSWILWVGPIFHCHHVFVGGFRRDCSNLGKNVVIYKDINYAKQAAYKRDIDRALLKCLRLT